VANQNDSGAGRTGTLKAGGAKPTGSVNAALEAELRQAGAKAGIPAAKGKPSGPGAPSALTVKAPSLDNLQVTVPRESEISSEELLFRFHELVRAKVPSRERAAGEPVQMGDTVLLDTLGYAAGRLIPFSARSGLELEMAPQDQLPGLCEQLVGTPVGEGKEVEITLPDNYPVESLRGVRATFLVDVAAAWELKMPADPEADAFVKTLGRGNNLEEVMEALADDIATERAEDMWLEAQERVMDELVRRTEVPVTTALVDEEIRQAWNAAEGRMLQEKNFAPDELQEAVDGWLGDANTRLEAERRLRIAYALKAIIDRDGLKLTQEKLDEVLEEAAAPFGMSLEEAKRSLSSPQVGTALQSAATQVMAVRYVMSKARIQFEGVPGVFSGSGKQLQ
jgi:trigger factor